MTATYPLQQCLRHKDIYDIVLLRDGALAARVV